MSEATPKKEKKDKKRKSDAADLPVQPDVVPPEQGSASAEAVTMEVDGQASAKKVKKEKKEKRKSLAGEGEEVDKKVGDRSPIETTQVRIDADLTLHFSARVPRAPRRHFPHSFPPRRQKMVKETLSDGQARVESASTEARGEGGRESSAEGG